MGATASWVCVAGLREFGVSNLQSWPAVLEDEDSGRSIEGYAVVNVIGFGPDDDDARAILRHRDTYSVLVSEPLRDFLPARAFDMLTFEDVDESDAEALTRDLLDDL